MQEIVEAIRSGDRSRLADLYEQNTGLLFTLARRYRGRDPMVSDEDLMQAGFLGLVEAVGAWEPARGAWSTIATLYVMKAMREALGIRSTRKRAHLGAVSLDEPISEEGDATRADMLPDESLPDSDERVLYDERRAAVRAAVGRLEGRKRDVVEWHDLEGQTLSRVGGARRKPPAREPAPEGCLQGSSPGPAASPGAGRRNPILSASGRQGVQHRLDQCHREGGYVADRDAGEVRALANGAIEQNEAKQKG